MSVTYKKEKLGYEDIYCDAVSHNVSISTGTGTREVYGLAKFFALLAGADFSGPITTTNVTASGTGQFTGLLTCAKSSGTGLAVTANATVGGTLAVTGATTLAALTTSGTLTANAGVAASSLTVSGTSSFTGAMTAGAATHSGNIVISGAATLTVGGTSTLTGAVSMGSNLTVTGTVTALGAINLGSTAATKLGVDNASTASYKLATTTFWASQDVLIGGNLTVTGSLTTGVGANLSVNDLLTGGTAELLGPVVVSTTELIAGSTIDASTATFFNLEDGVTTPMTITNGVAGQMLGIANNSALSVAVVGIGGGSLTLTAGSSGLFFYNGSTWLESSNR